MRLWHVASLIVALVFGTIPSALLTAQEANSPGSGSDAVNAPSRIVERIEDGRRIRLTGNTHPKARPEFDRGMVDPQLPMERMLLVLKRSEAQESALKQFMAEQLDPASRNFHHWLDAKEFGARYGVAENDIETVSSWLENQGFRVDRVTNGRTFLQFSGTAFQVEKAFQTEIHRYNVRGEMHIANNQDPSIPEALAPVVLGIKSLHDFFPTPAHVNKGNFRRDAKSGKWAPADDPNAPKPSYIVSAGAGYTPFEEVAPYDFAAIYNVLPLWKAGIDGTGVTIAIAGGSEITLGDVTTFRSGFGLPAKAPSILVNGTDPGVSSDAEKGENTLDVEWSGAVAKGATIKLVVSKSSATEGGAGLSALYIVDASPKIASIMSFSYQSCELHEGQAGNAAENSMWQQGAAEGISIFIASGDYASAQCDGGENGPYLAQNGLLVSGLSSTPYDTAVGGTDLNWYNYPQHTYWSATNNSTTGASALGYMPEVPWDTNCASISDDQYIGTYAQGYDQEQSCQALINDDVLGFLVNSVGGSGGKSSCIDPTGTTNASCAAHGGYPKPSWQTGAGVPKDNARDVPDLSLFASANGLNSGYLFCDTTNGPCDFTNANDAEAQVIGGTSVASPAMAGIMALVLQKQGGAAQGLANPVFYSLAAKDNLTSCNSNTSVAGNSCIFNDITSDTIAVPCQPGSPDCTVHHAGDTVGIMNGWNAGAGYDLATGLGSVNAYNLVNAWPAAVTTAPTITLTPSTLTFASTTEGSTTAAQVVTVKNTGTAAATLTSETITGTNTASFVKSATTCGATLAVSATCTVSVEFKPAASGKLTAALSIVDSATGSPQSVPLTGTGVVAAAPTLSVTATSIAFPAQVVKTTSDAQIVTVKNSGTLAVALTSIVVGGTNAPSFLEINNCGASLAAGASCSLYVAFEPASAAALTGSISITDNATGSPQKIALTGTGTAAPSVKLSATSLAFPATAHGTTSETMPITLTNGGAATLTLSALTLTGTNPAAFEELNTCGAILSPGASCVVYVAFKPAAAAVYKATLSIADTGAASPQLVTLTGTGQ